MNQHTKKLSEYLGNVNLMSGKTIKAREAKIHLGGPKQRIDLWLDSRHPEGGDEVRRAKQHSYDATYRMYGK